jgi:hypothetical protein
LTLTGRRQKMWILFGTGRGAAQQPPQYADAVEVTLRRDAALKRNAATTLSFVEVVMGCSP